MVGVPAALHCCSQFHHTPPISSHKRHHDHGSNQQHSVNMCTLADLAQQLLLQSLSITRKHLREISRFVPQLGCSQPAIAVEPAKACCLSAESKRWTCISNVWHPYITHNKDRQRALASYTHLTQQQVQKLLLCFQNKLLQTMTHVRSSGPTCCHTRTECVRT